MAPEAIGEALQQGRTFTRPGPFHRALGRCPHRQNVHAIHFFSGHAEGAGLAPDLRVTGGPVVGHADGPLVVLDHENDRQLPQLRHVHALEELTVVAGSIAEERCCHGVAGGITEGVALVAAGEGRSECHGNALSDEGKAAKKVMLLGEQVH